jgi:hypothetical protein
MDLASIWRRSIVTRTMSDNLREVIYYGPRKVVFNDDEMLRLGHATQAA